MTLFNALLRFKEGGRLQSFEMHGETKATLRLANGKSLLVYMSSQYIVGGAEIAEAAAEPSAKILLQNDWDTVANSAFAEANRLGIEIYKFAAFRRKLGESNA